MKNLDKKNAQITGLFFIIAAITSIAGLILYNPVLKSENFLSLDVAQSNQVVLGAFFELMLAFSAVGTAIMLYPYLQKFNQSWALGYVCFRILEVVFILIGTISVLAMVSLSKIYLISNDANNLYFNTLGLLLKAIHDWTFMLGPNFMLGINTFIYSYIFYRSEIVPKKLAILGLTAAILIFIAAILEMFGIINQISTPGLLLALPIFVFEMSLSIWLISKGFREQKLV